MTRSEIRTELQNLLGETATDFYTTTKLDDAIYEACIDMAFDAQPIKGTKSHTTVAGTAEYAFDTNQVLITAVTWNSDETDLLYRTQQELDIDYPTWRDDDNGTPEFWTDGDTTNYIRLYPTPDSAKTCKVYWIGIPIDFAGDSTEAPFPAPFHKGIKYGAAVILLEGDPSTANDGRIPHFRRRFREWINRFASTVANPTGRAAFITSSD